MSQTTSILQLFRDLLTLYSNFLGQLASLQKEHGLQAQDLQSYMSTINAVEFLKGLSSLDPEKLQRVFKVLIEIGTISAIQNPLQLGYKEKLALVEKLNDMVRELEKVVGISNINQVPTDLDQQLVERCKDKDYHDIVTNAFPLLEDRIRDKVSVDRSYYGDGLIDYALSPKTCKLVLGDSEAEKEGAYFLFKGAIKFFRNPPAHTLTIPENRNAGLKVMYLTDLLIKLLEQATHRTGGLANH